MISRLPLSFRAPLLSAALLSVALLAACSQQQAPAPADAPATATTAAAPEAAPATEAPATTAPAPAEAAAPAAANNNPVVAPQGPAPIAGTDYIEIAGGQPYQPAAGKIEVVEVFGYTCPHCAHFETLVESWKAKQPADVQFTPVAAPFGGYWMPYAKAFYTAQAMGLLDKTHEAVFNAIHVDRSLPAPPTVATPDQIAAFYAKYGVDAKSFASTMSSFAIDAKVKRANQFIQRSGVEATPTIVVAGKYRVVGKGFEDMLRITDHLVAQERAKGGTTAGG